MGCLCARERESYQEFEKLIREFEKTLGFSLLDVYLIDRTLNRYSSHRSMSKVHLEIAFSQLKIPIKGSENFYNVFFEPKGFLIRKLSTLGVLLGTGSNSDKLKVLFQNYDTDLSGSLGIDEIKIMIDDIMEIACDIIPQFAKGSYMDNNDFHEYIEVIRGIRRSITNHFLRNLLEDKRAVTLEDLNTSFRKNEVISNILSPTKIRIYCVMIRKNIIKTVEFAIKTLDEQDNFQEILTKEETEVTSPRRRTRKSTRNHGGIEVISPRNATSEATKNSEGSDITSPRDATRKPTKKSEGSDIISPRDTTRKATKKSEGSDIISPRDATRKATKNSEGSDVTSPRLISRKTTRN